jgi:hypothetical protein
MRAGMAEGIFRLSGWVMPMTKDGMWKPASRGCLWLRVGTFFKQNTIKTD